MHILHDESIGMFLATQDENMKRNMEVMTYGGLRRMDLVLSITKLASIKLLHNPI